MSKPVSLHQFATGVGNEDTVHMSSICLHDV